MRPPMPTDEARACALSVGRLRRCRAHRSPLTRGSRLGTRSPCAGPREWSSAHEMGSRKSMRKKRREPGAFEGAWGDDQRAWLEAARANLRAGGRAALVVGDGENGIDALRSTCDSAKAVGFSVLCSATVTPTLQRSEMHKGRRRPEHAILLEAP